MIQRGSDGLATVDVTHVVKPGSGERGKPFSRAFSTVMSNDEQCHVTKCHEIALAIEEGCVHAIEVIQCFLCPVTRLSDQ